MEKGVSVYLKKDPAAAISARVTQDLSPQLLMHRNEIALIFHTAFTNCVLGWWA